MTLVVVGFVGGLFGGIGVIDWAGHIAHGVGNSAPYIYLVLSVGGGLVMGIAAVISLPLRSALANAFLLPAAFTLTSVAFAAFKQGALFTLATVGLVGLVGAALAAALCLLTVVLLKWDVWAMLSRWLAAREPKRQSRTVREEIRLTETEIDGSAVAEIESINVELSRMDVRRPELERRKAELEKRPDSTRL
jgi:hypothetical protein